MFWKELEGIGAYELIHHRILWSLLFVLLLIRLRNRWADFAGAFRSARQARLSLLSGLLLSGNWLIFIWAVHHERVIETSLGYYLVPFISTLLGFAVLRETISRRQLAALLLAFAGVCILFLDAGTFPWVGLGLALSFGFYGLLRKQSQLGSLTGLGVETALLLPWAVATLLFYQFQGTGALGRLDVPGHLLLMASGVVTAVPLLLFATGARMIPLSTVGILQFIAPTTSLLLGVFLYKEPFGMVRFGGFVLIWLGLVLSVVEFMKKAKRPPG